MSERLVRQGQACACTYLLHGTLQRTRQHSGLESLLHSPATLWMCLFQCFRFQSAMVLRSLLRQQHSRQPKGLLSLTAQMAKRPCLGFAPKILFMVLSPPKMFQLVASISIYSQPNTGESMCVCSCICTSVFVNTSKIKGSDTSVNTWGTGISV